MSHRRSSSTRCHYDEDDKTLRAEFIELSNVSDAPVDLTAWQLKGAVNYTFADGAAIAARGYLVIAENPATMQSLFGYSASLGPWDGRLKNSGETITLSDPTGNVIDRVDYKLGFPWPIVGDRVGSPLASPSIQLINPLLENDLGGAWRSARPSPGTQNASFAANAPPSVRQVGHAPLARVLGTDQTILPGEDVRLTAKVTDADGVASVSLDYQVVNPGDYIKIDDPRYNSSWTNIAMSDDGSGGDEFAGDEIFSALIPASLNTHRRLLRYRITATDAAANSQRVPYADDPTPNFAYFVYGTLPTWTASDRPGVAPAVTYDFTQMEPVAVYQLLTTRSEHEEAQHIPNASSGTYGGSDYRWDGALVYEGKVYDHIRFRARGGVWRYSMGKNMWKFDFNRGHRFVARDDYGKRYDSRSGTNSTSPLSSSRGISSSAASRGSSREPVSRTHNLSGSPAPLTHYVHFRIIENADENGTTTSQFEHRFPGALHGDRTARWTVHSTSTTSPTATCRKSRAATTRPRPTTRAPTRIIAAQRRPRRLHRRLQRHAERGLVE